VWGPALLVAAVAAGGCLHARSPVDAPAAPDRPWSPPGDLRLPPAESPGEGGESPLPPALLAAVAEQGGVIGLPQALDLALRSSPRTREAWLAARAAAAEVGSRAAAFWPDLGATLEAGRVRGTAGGGQLSFQQNTATPALDLSWLLFDFGGREAEVTEARQLLVAANFAHHDALQDVVLDVTTAYYSYVSARALRDAANADVEGATASLEAAERRHQAGLATIADVLQARTALSSSRLALQRAEGDMQVIRGALATAMGLPADLPVEAAPLPEDIPVAAASEGIEQALSRALALRPDVLAARARAAAAGERIAQERADGLPALTLSGAGSRVYYDTAGRDPSDNYSARVLLRVPLFSGREHHYDVERARQEAAQAQAQVATLANQVRLQVWTAYYDLQTAAARFATTGDLLASAEESARVAAGRYQAGVGSILDLLAAQSALADARAQRILARADWLLSLARLAHDTGNLEIPAAGPLPAGPTSFSETHHDAPANPR
jgi:outer membrane protein TolC